MRLLVVAPSLKIEPITINYFIIVIYFLLSCNKEKITLVPDLHDTKNSGIFPIIFIIYHLYVIDTQCI